MCVCAQLVYLAYLMKTCRRQEGTGAHEGTETHIPDEQQKMVLCICERCISLTTTSGKHPFSLRWLTFACKGEPTLLMVLNAKL